MWHRAELATRLAKVIACFGHFLLAQLKKASFPRCAFF